MSKTPLFFLIDDDEDDRELFESALSEADPNIDFISAVGGHEALELIHSGKVLPDFIFLDLNMPRMGGKECLAELKKNKKSASIPVIIFSTSSDPNDKDETRELGAVDFITKPSKPSELKIILSDFISNLLHN